MIMSEHLIFVFDTGWYGVHWIEQCMKNARLAGSKIQPADYAVREHVQTLGLPDWQYEPSWGGVYRHVTDDGAVVIVRRSSFEERAVVLASSEAFWTQFVLEFRGS